MGAREHDIVVNGQTPQMASTRPGDRSGPTTGDVLISRSTARADVFAISTVPTESHGVATRYQDAVLKGSELARGLAVDGWYTCDHTHFVRIAKHRA
jgi:hypothetical protein